MTIRTDADFLRWIRTKEGRDAQRTMAAEGLLLVCPSVRKMLTDAIAASEKAKA